MQRFGLHFFAAALTEMSSMSSLSVPPSSRLLESEDKLNSTISINLRASKLLDKDILGHSDSFAIVYVDFRVALSDSAGTGVSGTSGAAPPPQKPGAPRDVRWERIGITETCADDCNPRWAKSFQVPYFFERAQRIAVDVYDRDSKEDEPLSMHDFLGTADCSMPTLVRARGQQLELPLKDEERPDQNCGTITLVSEEMDAFRSALDMIIEVGDIKKGFSWRSEEPSLTISRLSVGSYKEAIRHAPIGETSDASVRVWKDLPSGSGELIVVHGPIKGRRMGGGLYSFDAVTINFQRLCFGNTELPLHITLTGRKGTLLGSACVSLTQWAASPQIPLFYRPLNQHPSSAKKSRPLLPPTKRKEAATVTLKECNRRPYFTFLDYVGGGYEISLVLAIDFTASNGNPSTEGSLHFLSQFPNEYECAIQSVGEILAQYDSDQLFPAYGFGAKLPPQYRKMSPCFALTGTEDPNCAGIDGVLEAYRHTLYNVRFHGPTEFAEIIRTAIENVQGDLDEGAQTYTILLITTDGVINDMQDTADQIVFAAQLPISIVIIGVGGEDFSDMDKLDGDECRLTSSKGEKAVRDIVQFVPFRKYIAAPEVLAAKVLEEIPGQFVQHMRMNDIPPPHYVDTEE